MTLNNCSTSLTTHREGRDMLKHFTYAVATAVALALPVSLPVAAFAQDVAAPIALPAVTQDQVLAGCTAADATEAGCKALIAAYFAYLESTGVVGTDLEAAIAQLVVSLAEADVSPAIKEIVVAAITEIGTTYATGDQAVAILQIAQTIEDGGTIETGALGISGA